MFAQLLARGDIDLAQQTTHHVVEQFSLLVGKYRRTRHEEVSHAAKRLGAPLDFSACDESLKLLEQRRLCIHGVDSADR